MTHHSLDCLPVRLSSWLMILIGLILYLNESLMDTHVANERQCHPTTISIVRTVLCTLHRSVSIFTHRSILSKEIE